MMTGEKAAAITGGATSLGGLKLGSGRAVISSSQAEQSSWLRMDRTMSIFTYHLIEALTGHAQPAEGATEVLVTDVMSYVYRKVPQSAMTERKAKQQPDYQLSGNFPVAMLLGGKGLAKGMTAPDPHSHRTTAPPPTPEVRRTVIFDQTGQTVRNQTNIAEMKGGFVQPGLNVRGNVQQAGRDLRNEASNDKKVENSQKAETQEK